MRQGSEADEQVSDEALLSGVAIGDDQAIIAFVRRYQRRLFGLALGIVADPGIAEDVAQEAFIRILRHASVYDARRGSVSSWVLTIARNLAIDSLRMRRSIPTAPTDVTFATLTSSDVSPDDVAAARDSTSRTLNALASLPLEQRRCVVLASLYGRTAADIAALESIPLGTAKSRIRLGMTKLRDVLVKEEA